MLLCLTCDSAERLRIHFIGPTDAPPIDETQLARATIQRLRDEFHANFGKQHDDMLGDEVWAEAIVDGERIEVSLEVMSGFMIRAMEPSADRIILEIAASLARQPVATG